MKTLVHAFSIAYPFAVKSQAQITFSSHSIIEPPEIYGSKQRQAAMRGLNERMYDEKHMFNLKSLGLSALAAAALTTVSLAPAQVAVDIGVAPVCPYGYFDYAPYDCAPYGYYGPDWFVGGVFLGAGPWFHGPHGFYGHVDNRYDPHHGYAGPLPGRGTQPFQHFQGNEARDGRGNVGPETHPATNERSGGFVGGGRPGGGGRRPH